MQSVSVRSSSSLASPQHQQQCKILQELTENSQIRSTSKNVLAERNSDQNAPGIAIAITRPRHRYEKANTNISDSDAALIVVVHVEKKKTMDQNE